MYRNFYNYSNWGEAPNLILLWIFGPIVKIFALILHIDRLMLGDKGRRKDSLVLNVDQGISGLSRNREEKMPLFDLTEFFKLSSVLNYNLSAASLSRYNVLMYIIGDRRLDAEEKKDREQKGILMEALGYLFSVYSQKRRRLDPEHTIGN